jgi:hypothetical protein
MRNLIIIALVSLLLVSFADQKGKIKKDVLLVLTNPLGQESFSVFEVNEVDDVLVGQNTDKDYYVQNGVYRIESTSNNKLYHKKILIQD